MTAKNLPYKRVLLKLSGEALLGNEDYGIDPHVLSRMAEDVRDVLELGVQVGVVIGGGNIFRGQGLARADTKVTSSVERIKRIRKHIINEVEHPGICSAKGDFSRDALALFISEP